MDFDNYQKGLEWAGGGQYEQGWECLREHLRTAPQDVQALNDAGVILYHLGRTEEAAGLLTEARRLRADSPEITGNLLEAYLGGGRAAEATQLFDDMERAGIWSIDVANRTATMLLDQGHKGQALEVLLRSHRLWPQQEQLPPILDALRGQRPRVAFFRSDTGDDGRLTEVCQFVQQRFRTESYAGDDREAIARLMDWSDIAWFDRGGEILVEASRHDGTPKMVVNIRCSDLCDRWVKDVRWERMDILALIGSSVEEPLRVQVPEIHRRTRLVMVSHGVNGERYPLEPQLKQINGILVQLEAELEQQATRSRCPTTNVTKDDPGVPIAQGQ